MSTTVERELARIMEMSYFRFGTNYMPVAVFFYEKLFERMGAQRHLEQGRMTLWVSESFLFALAKPIDGNSASIGN